MSNVKSSDMRIHTFLFLAVVLAITLACTAPSSNANQVASTPASKGDAAFDPTPKPVEGERISLADAKKEFDAGTAVFIDVRTSDVYKQERIKGALNIPLNELDANINKIPKGKKIIAYCS